MSKQTGFHSNDNDEQSITINSTNQHICKVEIEQATDLGMLFRKSMYISIII